MHVFLYTWALNRNTMLRNELFIGSLLYIQRIRLSWKKKQHLQVFSKKLFVQWEALDYALIEGMESPQLQPLTGRISVGGKGKTVRCMLVWTHPHKGWGQMSSVLHVTATALTFPVRGENLQVVGEDDSGTECKVWNPKQNPPPLLKLEPTIQREEDDFEPICCWYFLRGAVPVPCWAVKYDNCRLFFNKTRQVRARTRPPAFMNCRRKHTWQQKKTKTTLRRSLQTRASCFSFKVG